MDQQEILANFMAITAADDAAALQCLEATNWSLEEACSLYFASHDGQGACYCWYAMGSAPACVKSSAGAWAWSHNRALHGAERVVTSHNPRQVQAMAAQAGQAQAMTSLTSRPRWSTKCGLPCPQRWKGCMAPPPTPACWLQPQPPNMA